MKPRRNSRDLFLSKMVKFETKLAGRSVAHAAGFTELLAPDAARRSSRATSADSEANARMMKPCWLSTQLWTRRHQ